MIQLYKMAFRDLGRNRRRSFFSALALAMGLALLLLMAAVVNGEMRGALESSIKLNSGHLQVRASLLQRRQDQPEVGRPGRKPAGSGSQDRRAATGSSCHAAPVRQWDRLLGRQHA